MVGEKFGVRTFGSLDEALGTDDAIFDLATPPAAHVSVLERVPAGAGVLIQKPMGSDLDEATKILEVCRERKLRAAVNFQLRFSPMMMAVRDALDRGLLGRAAGRRGPRVDRHPVEPVRLPEGTPAHRDRRPLDPLSGPHPQFSRRSGRRARQDHRPSLVGNGADPHRRHSRLRRRSEERDVGQP